MRTSHIVALLIVSLLSISSPVLGQTTFDDSAMRRNISARIAKNYRLNVDWKTKSLLDLTDIEARLNTVSRIKRNYGISFDWKKSTLLQLTDAEARLNTVKRIERTHGVRFDWRKSTLLQLTDAEARMNTAKRLTKALGKKVNRRDYTLRQLTEAEAKLTEVDVKSINREVARKAPQGAGNVANRPTYITKIEEDKNDVLILSNGGIVEITQGFLGFVGFRKDAILFKDGARWKIWIEGKKVYKCDLLKAPSGRASGSGEKVYISEVKGDGKILVMLDGSIMK